MHGQISKTWKNILINSNKIGNEFHYLFEREDFKINIYSLGDYTRRTTKRAREEYWSHVLVSIIVYLLLYQTGVTVGAGTAYSSWAHEFIFVGFVLLSFKWFNNNLLETIFAITEIDCLWYVVFNATLNNISVISWQSALLVEEIGVPVENHRPVASNWQALSCNHF
jgi:hypothetical protein